MPRKAEEASADFVEELVDEGRKDNIYWAPAKSYQLGNFQKEERAQSGHITQREVPIRFDLHIFVTNKQEEIDYIEGNKEKGIKPCDGFEAGEIIKCKNMEAASMLTAQQERMKDVKTIHSEIDESVKVT